MVYLTPDPVAVTEPKPREVSWARVRRDERNRFAGVMYRRCASLQKILALATGHHCSWISRQCAGDPTGAVQRFYDLLVSLTSHHKSDPSHLIVGGILQVEEALGDLPFDEVHRRMGEVMAEEVRAQAAEDLASYRVMECLSRVQGPDATPKAFEELHAALMEHEEAQIKEMAVGLTVVLLNRAYRRRKGWS